MKMFVIVLRKIERANSEFQLQVIAEFVFFRFRLLLVLYAKLFVPFFVCLSSLPLLPLHG